jgi:hypothetical protein
LLTNGLSETCPILYANGNSSGTNRISREHTLQFPEIPSPESLLANLAERDDLDYKAKINDSKKGHADFIKDVGAISNTGGGVLVFGVLGGKLEGIPEAELPNYDPSRLGKKIEKFLAPPPPLSTAIVEDGGKKFPFVRIGGISDTPVIVCCNMNDETNKQILREGSIYIRQNTKTVEISNESSARQLIGRIVDRVVHERVAQIVRALNAGEAKRISTSDIEAEGFELAKKIANFTDQDPACMVSLLPAVDLPNLKPLDASEILKFILYTTAFEYPSALGQSKSGTIGTGAVRFSDKALTGLNRLAYLNTTGGFFWVMTLLESLISEMQGVGGTAPYKKAVSVDVLIVTFVAALKHAQFLFDQLPNAEPWTFRFTYRNVGDRNMMMTDTFEFPGMERRTPLESNVFVERKLTKVELSNHFDKIVFDMLEEMMQKFNWSFSNPDLLMKKISEAKAKAVPRTHH